MSCRTDPAMEVIATMIGAMAEVFRPDQQCLPRVGATTDIRFLAGDTAPIEAWDSHKSQGCDEPMVWVRIMRRYRSREFPTVTLKTSPCKALRVVALEVGVAWCANVEEEPSWADLARQAEESQDTTWRIEEALCMASALLAGDDAQRHVGTDIIAPWGPEGGVIAWTGVLYADF